MEIVVDIKLLEKQIYDVLKSDMPEESKSGLHNLLGLVYDTLTVKCLAIVYRKEIK